MDFIVGIDLGTTNSAIACVKDGKPVVLHEREQAAVLPSVVGFDSADRLLVGAAARNQALVAPQRTIKSIKRRMGQEAPVMVAGREYAPQEISAMILRTLKDRAERVLDHPVSKAVITVPAYFSETEREATRQAGELAGLEVVRIINEPTAAALTYQPHSERNERLLVYDLGGGTFDVSIVQIEQGVIEVLASHGDTHLGGDDFDQLLLDHVCDRFQEEHSIDLRDNLVARSRLLQAVERAKQDLSREAVVTIAEEFITEHEGRPLNLSLEIERHEYENLIESLLGKTLNSVDQALADAGLRAADIDRVLLVGGSSRTPLVHRLLMEQLGHEPHLEVDPDLCVALGAAVQGALVAGVDVGAVLVDITPHTLGIRCRGRLDNCISSDLFSPIIARNSALPASRSEIYYTSCDGQEQAEIQVYQGEHRNVHLNKPVGQFMLEGLDDEADQGNEILVRFDLDLDAILTVTAIERATGLERKLRIENAIERFRSGAQNAARERLARVFGEQPTKSADMATDAATDAATGPVPDGDQEEWIQQATEMVAKAHRLTAQAASEDADEIRELIDGIQQAQSAADRETLEDLTRRLEDLLFYLEDA